MSKMLNNHSKVGIAQIVFYAPVVPLAAYNLYRNGAKRPRMAWVPLLPFSLIRLAGGIVVILLETNPSSTGLIIATYILLGVGVIPLIISSLGLVRIILAKDFESNQVVHKLIKLIRLAFAIAAALLITGGSLVGNYKSSTLPSTGLKLVRAGYILFAVILALIMDFQLYLWCYTSRLSPNSLIILKNMLFAMPFLIVRNVYALISVYSNESDSQWNSVTGSAAVFACMALLMEYFVVAIYLYIGLKISHDQPDLDNNGVPKDTDFGVGNQESGRA